MIKCEHCQGEHDAAQRFCSTTGRLFAAERFFPPGMVLDGKYRLGALIGAGGMGAVLEATHILLDKSVAIKLLLPDFAANQEMGARLLREARAASATGHRNIALVTDLGRTTEGTLYVVMERLTGRSLDAVLRSDAPLPVPRASRIVRDLLTGLDAVHRRGIVHRDLKPSNVMLCTEDDGSGLVKILDFGISKQVGDTDLTTMGKILGTPRYMPPEQARGLPDIDGRADIYAAGAILYALLTAESPISGNNYNAVLASILEGKLAPPSSKVPSIPRALDDVVLRAMARSREQRFPDALSFRKQLLPFCGETMASSTQLGVGNVADPAVEAPAASLPLSSAELELQLVPLGEHHDPASGLPVTGGREPMRAAPSPGPLTSSPATGASPQRGSAEALGADLRPGTPGLLPEFQHPDDGPPLELAEPSVRRPGPTAPDSIYRPRTGLPWQALRKGALVALLLVAVAVAWGYRDDLRALLTGQPSPDPEKQVMVLVETVPADAEVYIDGVFQSLNPVPLPRSSERLYTVRVQAKGYLTEEIKVAADRTQAVRVVLRRRR